jgi:hypothetical protein
LEPFGILFIITTILYLRVRPFLFRTTSKGAKLYLCSLNDQIKIILELTKMDKVFDILPDREAFDAAIV